MGLQRPWQTVVSSFNMSFSDLLPSAGTTGGDFRHVGSPFFFSKYSDMLYIDLIVFSFSIMTKV